jgi:hypothetical protein
MVLFGLSGVSAHTSVVSRVFQTRHDGKKIPKKQTIVKKKTSFLKYPGVNGPQSGPEGQSP